MEAVFAAGHAMAEKLDEAEARIVRLRELLHDLEWCAEYRVDYDDTVPCCPCCNGVRPNVYDASSYNGGAKRGHDEECRLVAALTNGNDETKGKGEL